MGVKPPVTKIALQWKSYSYSHLCVKLSTFARLLSPHGGLLVGSLYIAGSDLSKDQCDPPGFWTCCQCGGSSHPNGSRTLCSWLLVVVLSHLFYFLLLHVSKKPQDNHYDAPPTILTKERARLATLVAVGGLKMSTTIMMMKVHSSCTCFWPHIDGTSLLGCNTICWGSRVDRFASWLAMHQPEQAGIVQFVCSWERVALEVRHDWGHGQCWKKDNLPKKVSNILYISKS